MSERFDPRSPSMNLWHALIGRGVDADEATTLMNGYAHELAERIRHDAASRWAPNDKGVYALGAEDALEGQTRGADLIDPHVRPASGEEQSG